jgi:hypothetical protein
MEREQGSVTETEKSNEKPRGWNVFVESNEENERR